MKILKNIFLSFLVLLPQLAQAQTEGNIILDGLNSTAQGTALPQRNLTETVETIINVVLSILGILFTILIIIGGFRWMTSGGNSQQVDAAKTMIRNAAIGLVIVIASYAIARFVLEGLLQAQTQPEV